MSEKRNIWFSFIGSFSPKFYKEIAHQSFKRSFGYLILLVLTISLVLSVKYTLSARGAMQKAAEWVNTEFAEKLPELLPEINIINGEVSSPVEQPLVHDEWDEFAFILDTTGTITSLDKYKNGILLKKHTLIVRHTKTGTTQTEEYDLSKVKSFKIAPGKKEGEVIILNIEGRNFNLTQNNIERWLHIARKVIFPIMAVSFFLYYLLAKIFHLLLFSLLSLIVNGVTNAKLKYNNLLNIGVLALTPSVLFAVLAVLSGLQIPLVGLIYTGLYGAFLIMAIRQFKTTSIGER